jgi:hypothetical protein
MQTSSFTKDYRHIRTAEAKKNKKVSPNLKIRV